MRRLVRASNGGRVSRPEIAYSNPNRKSRNGPDDYERCFKQLFCIAASELAVSLHDSLENIGVLFGEILNTGTISTHTWLNLSSRWKKCNTSGLGAAERGTSSLYFGRGQLLVLIRRVTRSDAAKLQGIGYRFATVPQIVDILARSMEVSRTGLLPKLNLMRENASREMLLEPGVHLACFAVRPVFRRGFDILVRKNAKALLPTVRLPRSTLDKCQFNLLKRLDGLTVATCLGMLRGKSVSANEEEELFSRQLFEALYNLTIQLGDPFIQEARLTARIFTTPSPHIRDQDRLEGASIIALRVITDVHSVGNVDPRFEYVPSRFYLSQQRVYRGSIHNERFSQEVYRDFGEKAIRANQEARSVNSRSSSLHSPDSPHRSSSHFEGSAITPTCQWPSSVDGRNGLDSHSSFKRLLVHEVDSGTLATESLDDDRVEDQTFAEELLALTIGERRKPRQVVGKIFRL